MNFYKLFAFSSVAVIVFLAGCGTPSGHVKVSKIPVESSNQVATIEVFDVGETPERDFKQIAYLSYDGVMGDFLNVVREFKIKAREIGADAIILDEPVTYTGSLYPYEHLMFRATAIAYEAQGARASR